MTPQRYAYKLTTPQANRPDIGTLDAARVRSDLWNDLAASIAAEPDMQPYSAHVLQSRWQQGLASIIIHDGQIIVYLGLDVIYDQTWRDQLAGALHVPSDALPNGAIYKGVSGWTHPKWRKRGLGVKARRAFYGAVLGGSRIYLASTSGVGAVPLWERLGWTLISWERYAFLASLEGWYVHFDENGLATRFYTPGAGWEMFSPMAVWNGGHVSPFEDTDHDWERYTHLGTSDEAVAAQMNTAFATAADNDLQRWRKVIMAVYPAKQTD